MKTPLERFEDLLRELFQFDCQDLDFDIDRLRTFFGPDPQLSGWLARVRADELFASQPCITVGADAIEPEFKRSMFAAPG